MGLRQTFENIPATLETRTSCLQAAPRELLLGDSGGGGQLSGVLHACKIRLQRIAVDARTPLLHAQIADAAACLSVVTWVPLIWSTPGPAPSSLQKQVLPAPL